MKLCLLLAFFVIGCNRKDFLEANKKQNVAKLKWECVRTVTIITDSTYSVHYDTYAYFDSTKQNP